MRVRLAITPTGRLAADIPDVVEMDAVPREGEAVSLPDGSDLTVRSVAWFPFGDDDPRPFVYVVVG